MSLRSLGRGRGRKKDGKCENRVLRERGVPYVSYTVLQSCHREMTRIINGSNTLKMDQITLNPRFSDQVRVESDETGSHIPSYAFWISRKRLEAVSFLLSSRCLSGWNRTDRALYLSLTSSADAESGKLRTELEFQYFRKRGEKGCGSDKE